MSFDNGLNAGETIITAALHSPNYAQGASGWSINRDGSAEFQNVLVRGTITASQIIGSTITGSTIVGGDFQSANFSNSAHTGFDLNANSTADAAGTPGNTIQVYTNMQVGPIGGNNIQFDYSGTVSAVAFNTGNPLDTQSAAIGATTTTVSGQTTSVLEMLSTTENGSVALALLPSPTVASGAPAQLLVATTGETTPTGAHVKGLLVVGDVASDVWELQVTNENSVIVAGPAIGAPALVLGDTFTPSSRLLVSVSELLSITGANVTETFYLNTNNTQAVAGGVVNPTLRQQSTTIAGPVTPGTGAYTSAGGIAGVSCPASGVITVWMRFAVTGNTGLTIADFVAGCPNIVNTTQATTVFTATDNRCAQVDGTFIGGANGASSIVTVFTQITASGLGNPLDLLTVTADFHQNSAVATRTFSVSKIEIGVIPSM